MLWGGGSRLLAKGKCSLLLVHAKLGAIGGIQSKQASQIVAEIDDAIGRDGIAQPYDFAVAVAAIDRGGGDLPEQNRLLQRQLRPGDESADFRIVPRPQKVFQP